MGVRERVTRSAVGASDTGLSGYVSEMIDVRCGGFVLINLFIPLFVFLPFLKFVKIFAFFGFGGLLEIVLWRCWLVG